LLLSLALLPHAVRLNVSVDDQSGDERTGALPVYFPAFPAGGWSQGNGCSACGFKPDSTEAFDNTWHDTTSQNDTDPRMISINFTGTAVYAFFILPDTVTEAGLTIFTNMTFTLDGQPAGEFLHTPTSSVDFLYNQPCYVNDSLVNGPHQLFISANAQTSSSLILFDYLLYTY
ncbi:hypothetical protein DFH11DRAFT_1464864, partial [Phellopilus nigrolimitatus]